MAITKVTGDLIADATIKTTNIFQINTISTDTTAATNNLYVLSDSVTLTLPANPVQGDAVYVINRSDTLTPVIARNGSNIMGVSEDFTIDIINAPLEFVYSDVSNGWIII
jgi:hypothetical protein